MKKQYVVCRVCNKKDEPLSFDPIAKTPRNTGTLVTMQCPDCCEQGTLATCCRKCCPTGHQTRFE